jgi:cellulose synthase/poly-beta-1,6-N-acetylglucosamine synthase-like glycosyltransferase
LAPISARADRKCLQNRYDAVERHFRGRILDEAVHGLERFEPQFSARRVITRGQARVLASLAVAVGLAFVLAPSAAGTCIADVLAAWFLTNAVFRGLLFAAGATARRDAAAPAIADADLPRYSILVPLHHEANIVPSLMCALKALDYPADRLDIKLIAEADDAETIAALQAADLDARFHLLRVPPGEPRTKPRACNYALLFLRGDLVVIYDAEDRPQTDQLRKAAAMFAAAPREIACLQARLNFYNAKENVLTRLFALDYALWFDYLLPGLERFAIPMPLGGTSNHFRVEALAAIHGWDPYNVTEDADIGIRLARQGFGVRTLDSTTFEEAPTRIGDWIKQRSRWQKGYMQTWLVHMRDPRQLLRNAGPRGFVGFQLFIGGTFVSALLNPILWAVTLAIFLLHAPMLGAEHVCLSCLAIGNGFFVALAMLGPLRRKWYALVAFGLLVPFYWGFISIAFYRALGQLVSKPFHWEKTRHGTSRFA